MRERHHHTDRDAAMSIERFINTDDVPHDLINRLVAEYIVEAECAVRGHSGYYADHHHQFQQTECKRSNCSAEIILD